MTDVTSITCLDKSPRLELRLQRPLWGKAVTFELEIVVSYEDYPTIFEARIFEIELLQPCEIATLTLDKTVH